ncbi:mannosyltransferase (pig-m) protein [Toxoplasma gondii ME49]|uniref:GPI mannosyltransferase 1 n=3 Tax=Toxoplasma gondii TaxID=5811 RepID=B6KA78_TOXGV|nr:mannosyltransferase (pig-m) protein [Toxoplasma gondii ME49]EPT26226.1 mannosyltransferase (pig-m) protein [Toxoplasma gondii ME49]ESS34831.1 mannosyltransferase (pig-m) protein [Toxoplasma gondii VEG]KYF47546.1 mannosyltransferase (pig-m) protein [Toxoplasma gondii ARI]CEL77311.1 TPA: GPI mannosyltransferase 1, putative [Toxoplasma gondii VEG]|eukprot:XP_002364256.1 mannosyltransferase (pig-m) protein [Toxoplasma gondii ME49]
MAPRPDAKKEKPGSASSSAAPGVAQRLAAPFHRVCVHLREAPASRLRLYVYAYAALLRAALIVYGEWQDRNLRVKFTDIDYKVYSDAARHVVEFESPYRRHTYRYTPLIAFLCVGNVVLHSACGKILFAAADLLLSLLTEKLLLLLASEQIPREEPGEKPVALRASPLASSANAASLLLSSLQSPSSSSLSSPPSSSSLSSPPSSSSLSSPPSSSPPSPRPSSPCSAQASATPAVSAFLLPALCWTIFPVAAAVSTRGNADVVPSLLCLLLLFLLRTNRLDAAAVCYGLAVHVKIFPVVYGIPILLFLRGKPLGRALAPADHVLRLPRVDTAALLSPTSLVAFLSALSQLFGAAAFLFALPLALPLRLLPRLNAAQWRFGLLSVGTFFGLGGIFYLCYGWPFLDAAYLYHFSRVDIRHNFSLFFYLLYLSAQIPSKALGIITFVPQMATCLLVGCYYAQKGKLELALFLQTLIFVALNKVCTAQYFLWWLALLPFAVASTDMRPRTCWQIVRLLAFFEATHFAWLFFGYEIEFLGKPSFFPMFVASLFFALAQFLIVWFFILKTSRRTSLLRSKDA